MITVYDHIKARVERQAELQGKIAEVSALRAAADARQALRDQFAMAALTGILGGRPNESEDYCPAPNDYAWAAYEMADAMLQAREVKNNG